MAMTQHPTKDTLLAYLEAPEQADFADLRLHIAACSDCRRNIVKLHNVRETIQQTGVYQTGIDGPSELLTEALEQQTIERYLDGQLPDPQAAQVKTLLQTDPNALKIALHYASHTHATSTVSPQSAALAPKQRAASPRTGTTSWLDAIKKLFELRPPVWISVPATAAVVLVLATAIMPAWQASPAKGIAIATYQDKAVIHFQGAGQLPGIGFFSRAHNSTQAFGPMQIHYNAQQTLTLQWPQVSEASAYHLTLYLISNGQKITVKELDVSAPQASLADFRLTPDKRYEWTLTGDTKDGKTFYASGGFVINNHESS
jgi:hypothetical protein